MSLRDAAPMSLPASQQLLPACPVPCLSFLLTVDLAEQYESQRAFVQYTVACCLKLVLSCFCCHSSAVPVRKTWERSPGCSGTKGTHMLVMVGWGACCLGHPSHTSMSVSHVWGGDSVELLKCPGMLNCVPRRCPWFPVLRALALMKCPTLQCLLTPRRPCQTLFFPI